MNNLVFTSVNIVIVVSLHRSLRAKHLLTLVERIKVLHCDHRGGVVHYLHLWCLSEMRRISRSSWAENPEQGRRFLQSTPCGSLPRWAAQPATPTWRTKFWRPVPLWRWVGGALFHIILRCQQHFNFLFISIAKLQVK